MTAVLKHELRGYAHSVSSYLFCAFLLLFVGVGALLYNIESAVANFEYMLEFVCIGLTVIIPVLTMRVIAEERRARTDQLLYSLPLTTAQIVGGKYLALLVVYLVPLCVIALYPLIFAQYGDVYLLTAYGSLFAFFIMGAAMIAVGMFISSRTVRALPQALPLLFFCSTTTPSVWRKTFRPRRSARRLPSAYWHSCWGWAYTA